MYLIANWKSHGDLLSTRSWVHKFLEALAPETMQALHSNKLTLVICPPTPLLYPLKTMLADYPIAIGAQDISSHPQGSLTGEVSGEAYIGIATYVLIGHDERRKLGEDESITRQKYAQARSAGLTPLLCVSSLDQYITDAPMVAFEPVESIGTGHPAGPEEVIQFRRTLDLPTDTLYIYGGSVNRDTITPYLAHPEIDGFLCGAASLDPIHFSQLANMLATHA
ncbi:MAG: triose-phosphate isomerase family protein [bacterium]